MTKDEALNLALEALETLMIERGSIYDQAITAIKEALAQPEHEPVPVKRMMGWVEGLKRQSDNGRYMHIPSGLNSGTCWELANELEQFINTTPPQRTWVGLTDEDLEAEFGFIDELLRDTCYRTEAKLRSKNNE